MNDRFKDQFRIPSSRWPIWDYGWNSAYFVTICTQKKLFFFGEILEQKMHLSEIGQLAEKHWKEIPLHFSFVTLGDFVIMPNHVHGIIIIDKRCVPVETPDSGVSSAKETPGYAKETPGSGVSTAAASQKWKPGILGVIINQYKRICTIKAKKINVGFDWQTRFYDHIIRDDQAFQRISEYIQKNPENWNSDNFYNIASGQS
jgi:REP element-mobilizing transposase RayT